MGLSNIPDLLLGWIRLRPLLMILLLEHIVLSLWCFFKGAAAWIEPQLLTGELLTVGFILGFFGVILVTAVAGVF